MSDNLDNINKEQRNLEFGRQIEDKATYRNAVIAKGIYADMQEIADNPDLPLEEIEFLNAAASDAPLRPRVRNGKVQLVPFPGHFTSVPLADIIDNFASSQEILNYQTFLMENNIVPQNYFASSMGEYSEELRTSIKVVMNWIDKNLYAEEGTDLYNEVNKGM